VGTIVGQPVTLYVRGIENGAGVATDPAAITLRYRKPDGTIVTKAIGDLTHDATGDYSFVVVPVAGEEGTWAYRYETENPTTADEGVFDVIASAVLSGDDEAALTVGPCHRWTNREQIEVGWTLPTAADDDTLIDLAVSAASDVCFQLGGRRWPGLCDRTVTPLSCGQLVIPWPEGGEVAVRPVSSWHGRRGVCGGGAIVDLGLYPVRSISEVRVDGDVVDAADYTLWANRYLVRQDSSWPCLGDPWDDPAPLEVDLTFGVAPPSLGVLAATALARELLLAMTNADTCRLDRRVRSVVREGVSVDYALPGLAESLNGGQTGIPEVDLFVHAHNPHRLRRAARFIT
jgi:hypothetical protein